MWIARGEPLFFRDYILQCHAAQFLFLHGSLPLYLFIGVMRVSVCGRGRGCTLKVQHTNLSFPSARQRYHTQRPSQVVWLLSQLHHEHCVNPFSAGVFCAAASLVSGTLSSFPFLLLSFPSAVLQCRCESCRCETPGLKCTLSIALACTRWICHNDKVHLSISAAQVEASYSHSPSG